MDLLVAFWFLLIGLVIGLVIGLTLVFRAAVNPLHKKIERLSSNKHLESFIKESPYNPDRFRFIGDPVDGIQFEDDRILFINIKKKKSDVNSWEKQVKSLVENGKVEWLDF